MLKKDALKHYKTVARLASAAGVSRQAVYKWRRVVPKRTAFYLMQWTEGQLQMDPSLYDHRGAAKYRRKQA